MEKIPEFVPWSMQKFVRMNDWLLGQEFLTSGWANIIGLALIVLIVFGVYKHTKKKVKTKKFK